MVHVLMINYEFPPIGGGAGQAHRFMLQEFARDEDLCIDVLTAGERPGIREEAFAERIRLHRVGLHKQSLHHWRKKEVLEWLYKASAVYRRLVRENHYALVHAISAFPSGWFAYRGRRQFPAILSLRGSDVPGVNARLAMDYKLLGPLFRRIWRSATLLVANSRGLRQRARRFLPDVAIEVIPNGVDVASFHPSKLRKSAGKLLSVGRLTPTKRVETLLQAVALLRKKEGGIRLTLVGDGPQSGLLAEMARSLGILEAVDFRGRVPAEQMPEIYREHDLYVSASCQEGMSNAMLEGLASGLPLISTPCEGLEELLVDNGVIVEDQTAAGLAAAIGLVLGDPERYRRYAEQARAHAQSLSWGACAAAYRQWYQRIIETQPGSSPAEGSD